MGDALAWLDSHVNLEAIESGRAGRAREPTLERIRRLLGLLADPQRCAPVLHVTGTNGKGSTTRMVTELLMAHGLVVGTYTSPHLERLNERISIDTEPIDDDELASVLGVLQRLEASGLLASGAAGAAASTELARLAPTWFELVTAAAFVTFADHAVAVQAIEVGLGGRYDATNVADGTVCCITNIELDHTAILGPTRAHIAREKAGIIKPSSTVVLGEDDEALLPIFLEVAEAAGAASVVVMGRDFGCTSNQLAVGGRLVDLRTPRTTYDDLFVGLHGPHQAENAAIAVTAVESLFGRELERALVEAALSRVRVPGRLEVLRRHPLVVLDGAHNAAGALAAGRAIAEDFARASRVLLVMGCLRGRDPAELLAGFSADRRLAHVYACAPVTPRAQAAELVVGAARSCGIAASQFAGVADALEAALAEAGPQDLVLVSGSLYVVGAARSVLEPTVR